MAALACTSVSARSISASTRAWPSWTWRPFFDPVPSRSKHRAERLVGPRQPAQILPRRATPAAWFRDVRRWRSVRHRCFARFRAHGRRPPRPRPLRRGWSVTAALKAVTSPEMPLVTSAVCRASSLMASATTAKPLPCSPARAATMRALMARIPTSAAISPMRAVLLSTACEPAPRSPRCAAEGAHPFGHAPASFAGGLHPVHAVAGVVDGPVGRLRDLGHRRGGGAERVVDIRGAAAQVDQPGLHLHRLIIDQLQERRDIDDLETQLAQAVAQPPARPAILVQPGTSFGGSRGVGGRSRGRMGLPPPCGGSAASAGSRRFRKFIGMPSLAEDSAEGLADGGLRSVKPGKAQAQAARSASAMAAAVASSDSRMEAWRLR
jgi:hypothetical protein